jgi:hypothetical protein
MDQQLPDAHEDLYMEIMEDAQKKGGFVIETEDERPEINFSVVPPDKPVRSRLQRHMPQGLLDGIELPENMDSADDISADDIDLSNISIQDMTFSEEATETWIDAIAEHFEHDYYSKTEVKNLFNVLDDEFFISAGSYMIELGGSAGPVTGFRRE